MGFINTFKEVMKRGPVNLKDPKFIKEFNEEKEQIKELEKLLEIAPEDIKGRIELDKKLLSYGIIGEKNIAYELENSHMPILILHDLYLEYEGLTAQIDYIIIDSRFLLVVECKNMVGEIDITNDGDFIRKFKGFNGKVYRREGMYSPISQNERHVELVKKIILKEYPNKRAIDFIKHIVVVANPKTIINKKYAKKEIKNSIIKHDQLVHTMRKYHEENTDGAWCGEEDMYNLAEAILRYNTEYKVDYIKKYNLELKDEVDSVEEDTEKDSLYEKLKVYRLNKSREEGVKPYIIYSNKQLEEIVDKMPKNIEELLSIKGFGQVKCEKYGDDIITIINNK